MEARARLLVRVLARLPGKERRSSATLLTGTLAGRPFGSAVFQSVKQPDWGAELLGLEPQPRVFIAEDFATILLADNGPPERKALLFDRNAGERHEHDQDQSAAETKVHPFVYRRSSFSFVTATLLASPGRASSVPIFN